ncbi:MAG TPA: phosphatidylserine decarboxylase [Vicinamibacterales bacterium]|nr:phosphatidylserine decarboxylase [Vicinamibacterales bacterium]
MTIDRAGYPFIGGTAALAIAAALTVGSAGAVPLFVLAAFFLYFFRDPDRTSPQDPNLVLSPADGRVLVSGAADPNAAPPGDWKQISIFLSPMDVHVNRTPVSGRVTKVDFRRGKFLPAYHNDAAAHNERSEVWVDHRGMPVVFRQLVGILARRVVCRVQPGTELKAGDRIGLMKFGSRMDVFLPSTAELKVNVGEHVIGGVTVIAVLRT